MIEEDLVLFFLLVTKTFIHQRRICTHRRPLLNSHVSNHGNMYVRINVTKYNIFVDITLWLSTGTACYASLCNATSNSATVSYACLLFMLC